MTTGDDILRLVSSGGCLSIINTTEVNLPIYVGSAYWYFTLRTSFGFAPTNYITQSTCDNSNLNGNLRLCWRTGGSGGRRIGKKTGLNSDNDFLRFSYLL